MSGPSRGGRATIWRRLPPTSTASRSRPRRTSHGRPWRGRPAGSSRHRPVMPRWLRTTTPPSKRRIRFFPTASTASSVRPSTRSATRVTAPRGCGLSAARRSPTSGCRSRAARWRESPSGTRIVFRAMTISRARAALAGAAAAAAWAAVEPLDRRLFGCDYSDVALLGKALTRGRLWPAVGLTLHAANGAVFGLAFAAIQRRTRARPATLALGLALAEHLALFPLSYLVDRRHPARGEPGIPPLLSNPRAFG